MSSLAFDVYVEFMLSHIAGQGEDFPHPNENSLCSFYPPLWWHSTEDKGKVNGGPSHCFKKAHPFKEGCNHVLKAQRRHGVGGHVVLYLCCTVLKSGFNMTITQVNYLHFPTSSE